MKIVVFVLLVLAGFLLQFTSSTASIKGRQKSPLTDIWKKKRSVSTNSTWENANERADSALTIVRQILVKGEPMVAENVGSCSKCDIYGISSVLRLGRCSVIAMEKNSQRVKVNLALPYVNATCNCIFSMAPGVLKATVEKFVLYMDAVVDFDNDKMDITEAKVKSPGKMSLTFEGEGVLNWVYKAIVDVFRPFIMEKFRTMLIEEVPLLIHNNKEFFHHLG